MAACNYDGGDCCGFCVIKKHCLDCVCLNRAYGYSTAIGNGFCNDETNTASCNYDGGDCCGSCINKEYCTNCDCLGGTTSIGIANPLLGNGLCNEETNNIECSYDGGDCCPDPDIVGNGFCNDQTNIGICNYDGGDCCVNVNTDRCSECNCLGLGVITSPGFPGYYGYDLDLTWLVQVQIGQTIEIKFLYFDVEGQSPCM